MPSLPHHLNYQAHWRACCVEFCNLVIPPGNWIADQLTTRRNKAPWITLELSYWYEETQVASGFFLALVKDTPPLPQLSSRCFYRRKVSGQAPQSPDKSLRKYELRERSRALSRPSWPSYNIEVCHWHKGTRLRMTKFFTSSTFFLLQPRALHMV